MRFSLPERGHVALNVYDAAGRLVRELEGGVMGAGLHTTVWDGRDDRGEQGAAGVYFARMQADGFDDAVKMVLVK